MPPARSRPRRLAVAVAAVGAVLAGTVLTVLAATPSQAATCSGYVALTFDDGPNGNTTTLLNTLRSAGVRATLFNIGQNARSNPSLVAAEAAAGMWIGNHSLTHSHMTTMSSSQMDSELSQTQQIIEQAGGGTPKLFRPPYGETNATLKASEAKYGLTEILWDVDSQDWNGASTASIVSAAGRLTNGQIILMHDQYATTIAAIPQIVSGLTSRGLCAGMISPSTGRAVAPDGATTPPSTTTPPASSPGTTTPPPAGGCQVTATVSAWNTGLTASIKIANTGGTAVNGWRLTFTLASGQTIVSGWNATYSPTSGQVTATNASYNAAIPAGGSVDIGFQANHTGNAAAPSGFALNGATCATA